VIETVRSRLIASLEGTGNLGGQTIGGGAGAVAVPEIPLAEGNTAFSITVTKVDDSTLRLMATGRAGTILRNVAVDYGICEDTSILTYSVASRVRMIVTGNSIIDGDLCSNWKETNINATVIPPFVLESSVIVDGNLRTVVSQAQYDADNCADYVDAAHEGMEYDEAKVDGTVLSMAELDIGSLGTSSRYYATNISSYDGDPEQSYTGVTSYIQITPQPGNPLPFGISKKYVLAPAANSYTEVTP